MFHIEGLLSTVGNTPLVELSQIYAPRNFHLYAKLEFLNPGGSSKDRAALQIIKAGIKNGDIKPDTVVIESSSGNMAISLAQICLFLGIRFISVIDPKTTQQNILILKTYQAEIELVSDPDPITGEFLPARLQRVQRLLNHHTNSFWPNQYANKNNAKAHYETTMPEIRQKLPKIDYLVIGVSTCGTIRGCTDYIKDHALDTKVIAVDGMGSSITGDSKGTRLLPGLGAGIRPPLYAADGIYDHIHVSDADSVRGCRLLVQKEAILAGGSAGGVMSAVGSLKEKIQEGSNVVVILPDRGERYLDTIYSDAWVKTHIGDVEE